MGEILNAGVQWRGYNQPDPANSGIDLAAATAQTLEFDQSVNRVLILNASPETIFLNFGYAAPSPTSSQLVLLSGTAFSGGLNTRAISLYAAAAATVYLAGFREDNESV